MKNKKRNWLVLAALLALGTSCTEPIDITLVTGENNTLLVEGGITDELKKHTISLTRTIDYLGEEITPYETGAIVSITDGTNVYKLTETENIGIYQTDSVAGEAGETYTLNIKLTDGEEYFAESYMKPVLSFDSIRTFVVEEVVYGQGPPTTQSVLKVEVFAQEPATPGDYYKWDLYINNQLDTDTLLEKRYENDLIFNGNYVEDYEIFQRMTKHLPQTDIVNFKVAMSSVSKVEYDHYIAVFFETAFGGGPFETPPANVPTNVSGGALGFFTANSKAYAESSLTKSDIFGGL